MAVFLKFNKVDETIAGTIKKIMKGFLIPPVRNNRIPNNKRSKIKIAVDSKSFTVLFLNKVFL